MASPYSLKMTERPILFNAEMVLAILENRKTQTRRVVKPQPIFSKIWEYGFETEYADVEWDNKRYNEGGDPITNYCPHGVVGDRLWVKETFGVMERTYHPEYGWENDGLVDDVDVKNVQKFTGDKHKNYDERQAHYFVYRASGYERCKDEGHWKPSIFMPRHASRILLEITNVRMEQVKDISRYDAMAEGCPNSWYDKEGNVRNFVPQEWYRNLWDSINAERDNGAYAWEKNPYVWVIEFKRIP